MLRSARKNTEARGKPNLRRTLTEGVMVLCAAGMIASCGSQPAPQTPATPNQSGYTEMKRTTKGKMAPAQGAVIATAEVIHSKRRGDAVLKGLNDSIKELKSCKTWLVFKKLDGRELLVNPNRAEPIQPLYSGVLMRNITLSDGTKGDFVVRIYVNETRVSEGGSELDPILDKNGKVSPENVLFQLVRGKYELTPDSTSEVCIHTPR